MSSNESNNEGLQVDIDPTLLGLVSKSLGRILDIMKNPDNNSIDLAESLGGMAVFNGIVGGMEDQVRRFKRGPGVNRDLDTIFRHRFPAPTVVALQVGLMAGYLAGRQESLSATETEL